MVARSGGILNHIFSDHEGIMTAALFHSLPASA
jgi:hypothetical protein